MMKRFSTYLTLFVLIGCFPGVLLPENLNIVKVGEWGIKTYQNVVARGVYAYCLSQKSGLDILDINAPGKPQKVGNYDTVGSFNDFYISGNYVYVVISSRGLQVIDVSNPSSPSLAGECKITGECVGVFVDGNYAYVAESYYHYGILKVIDISTPSSPSIVASFTGSKDASGVYVSGDYLYLADGDNGLLILDISTPTSPSLIGKCNGLGTAHDVFVQGNYAYVIDINEGLRVVDVSNPSSPTLTGTYDTLDKCPGVYVKGYYAFLANDEQGLKIIDISNPSNPTFSGSYHTTGTVKGVYAMDNFVYVADWFQGLKILDVSTPSSPTLIGEYGEGEYCDEIRDVFVLDNYAYAAGGSGLYIINISHPSSPFLAGSYKVYTPGYMQTSVNGVYVKGKYAYVIVSSRMNELRIIDISTPSLPILVGKYTIPGEDYDSAYDVFVSGHYAYVGCSHDRGLQVIDIANPSMPVFTGSFSETGTLYGVYVRDNYAYVSDSERGFKVFDIAAPSEPKFAADLSISGIPHDVYVQGRYAYVADTVNGLHIIDISVPSSPVRIGLLDSYANGVFAAGNYVYFTGGYGGLQVADISAPFSPSFAGWYDFDGYASAVYVQGNYAYVGDGTDGKLFVFHFEKSAGKPHIGLNRSRLNFSADTSGTCLGAQDVFIDNLGGGSLEWTVSADQYWLHCTPLSGTGSGEITVSVDTTGLPAGFYFATITISDPNAVNSPQYVDVGLRIYEFGQTKVPFGTFSTPQDGSIVSGSIPVTGWALDDIEVESVNIYWGEEGNLFYLGDAVFVEGARPDVERDYPWYPMNYRAGWGYMMLTNFLPNNGNGTYTLHALAVDAEGHQVSLGKKTITLDNANRVKPFGAIDLPAQGGTASGNNYVNFGWALTPPPNTIPTDGSTITVWVDGVPLGNPVYNQYREDIATLFPGYTNSDGAGSYFYLDTTPYKNGVHTIAWSVKDNAGNEDGIGSRYFTIQNTGEDQLYREHNTACLFREPISRIPVDYFEPVRIKKGFNSNKEPEILFPDENDNIHIQIKELQRLEIHFSDSTLNLSPLPVGSFFDTGRGIFYWQPGVGFIGDYLLVFINTDQYGNKTKKNVLVTIVQKFLKKVKE